MLEGCNVSFGKRLKSLREQKELSQRGLAKVLNMAPSTLAMYEVDKREPDFDTVKKFADFFDVSVDWLLGRTDDPLPPGRAAAKKIEQALQDDDELLEFWYELSQREDLQLLFKQARELKPETIKQIVGIIKMIEDKEAQEP